ncbi:MAG TPA: hypothetical protein VKF60_12800 [Myxococcota bacterium]|nr:hypothetical protein [Myxococcota bacterium]
MLPPPSDHGSDEDTGWFLDHFLARRAAARARAHLDIVASLDQRPEPPAP